jgi:hypothetical protein
MGREFVSEGWYGDLGGIAVKHHVAFVSPSLGRSAKSREVAEEICSAVLGSHSAAKVVVRYGSGLTEVCS